MYFPTSTHHKPTETLAIPNQPTQLMQTNQTNPIQFKPTYPKPTNQIHANQTQPDPTQPNSSNINPTHINLTQPHKIKWTQNEPIQPN